MKLWDTTQRLQVLDRHFAKSESPSDVISNSTSSTRYGPHLLRCKVMLSNTRDRGSDPNMTNAGQLYATGNLSTMSKECIVFETGV
jgi:hypothetical protein